MREFSPFLLVFLILSGGLASSRASDTIMPEQVLGNAHQIDKLVAQNFKQNKIQVPEVTDDATFMRRAFLVAIGRIPTPAEALQFLELEHPDKRQILIDYLYSSEGYKSHMTNYYYDLFTLRERHGSGPGIRHHGRLIDWFRDAVEVNMAWDDLCRDLLTTKGNAYLHSGAAGYFEKGDAIDDHLSNTMRIFTGVRLECAQCHDDPFQEWEQMDFYNLKAFVAGPSGYESKTDYRTLRSKLVQLELNQPDQYRNTPAGRIQGLLYNLASVAGHGTPLAKGAGRVKLPSDYKYRDGKPGEMVQGRTPFGDKVRTKDDKNDPKSLEKFASWMTSDDTEQFAITIANRMWERVMGISLTPVTGDYVEPEDTEFRNLILKLAAIMKDYDYDLNTFQRTLMSTRTFQFVSSQKDLVNGQKNALDGRRVNRMSAEQIWDSMMSLTVPEPESLPKRQRTSLDFVHAGQRIMTKAEMVKKVSVMSDAEFETYFLELFDKLKRKEFPQADDGKSDDYAMMMGGSRRGKQDGVLRRASEFPTPAGGFFATFGQSTRVAAIDEASKEGTVSQALELLNGQVQQLIIHDRKSTVNQVVQQFTDETQRVKTIFLVVLNRAPSAEELELCLGLVDEFSDKEAAYRNIVAGLIASQEFYFIF